MTTTPEHDAAAARDRPTGEREAVVTFWDILIPGGADWPAASSAVADPVMVLSVLSDADRSWVEAQARAVAREPLTRRVDAVRRLEQQAPEEFARILSALYGIYYTSPAAQARVRQIAEAGPREPSPHFDPTLVMRVRTTQAGRL
jgi:hypothetical protein